MRTLRVLLLPAVLAFVPACGDLKFVAPGPGATVQGVQELRVTPKDNKAARVRFFANGQPFAQDDAPPFQVWWDSTRTFDGLNSFSAIAYDANNAEHSQGAIIATVWNEEKVYDHAARYAPVIHIDKDCLYRPCSVSFDGDDDWGTQVGNYDKARNGGKWPAYVAYLHILPASDGDGTKGHAFDYWYYYVFNEQPALSGVTYNKHDQDWERVVVFVPKIGGAPKWVRFHHHAWSKTHTWDSIKGQAVTDGKKYFRPVAYVFNEGHGSYGSSAIPVFEWALGGSFDPVVLTDFLVIGLPGALEEPKPASGTGYSNKLGQKWRTLAQSTGTMFAPPTAGDTLLPRGTMPDDKSTGVVGALPETPWSRDTWALPVK